MLSHSESVPHFAGFDRAPIYLSGWRDCQSLLGLQRYLSGLSRREIDMRCLQNTTDREFILRDSKAEVAFVVDSDVYKEVRVLILGVVKRLL